MKHKTGWFNESARHALAAKGVKTSRKLHPRKTCVIFSAKEKQFSNKSILQNLRERFKKLKIEEVNKRFHYLIDKNLVDWKRNEFWSSNIVSNIVEVIQNPKIDRRVVIIDLTHIAKEKTDFQGIRGFKSGFLVTVYEEGWYDIVGTHIKFEKAFGDKSQAFKFAYNYMKKHDGEKY